MTWSEERRAAARRRAWGRGPMVLRFEPLEGRQLMAGGPLPDLVASSFTTVHALDWGDSFHAVGKILNQGSTAAHVPFQVGIYASTTPTIGKDAVLLGEVTIPSGLGANQEQGFDQVVSLPQTALPGYAGKAIYINLWTDPEHHVEESNRHNNKGLGAGFDGSAITLTPHPAALLSSSSLGLSTNQTIWGTTIQLTAQIRNSTAGSSAASRARVVLTPTGLAPGSASDVTIGSLDVPAVPAYQTVNVVQGITLPAPPPTLLAGTTKFTLSLVQDSDYQNDALYPHVAHQGLGLDMAALEIDPNPNATTPVAARPDLAASAVTVPVSSLVWGQDFPLAATIQNVGAVDAGPFLVQFVLSGDGSGTLNNGIFLGAATVNGLKAGTSENLTELLHLPIRLPQGLNITGGGTGRVAVVIDPENRIDEPLKSNNVAQSNPVSLRLYNPNGTTGGLTTPGATTLGPITTAGTPSHPKHIHARVVHSISITKKVENHLKVFPTQVNDFFHSVLHGTSSKKKKR